MDASPAPEWASSSRRSLLQIPGGDRYDDELKNALFAFVASDNLEERWTDEPKVERGILDHLRAVRKR